MGLRREHDREQFPPRLIRFRAAPAYLGMNKNLFNQLIRPCVSLIPLGKRAIANSDRLVRAGVAIQGAHPALAAGRLVQGQHRNETEGGLPAPVGMEQRVPELDTPEIKRTVFVLPEWVTKNKQARVVVLNDVAQRIVDELRGQHPTYVFTWEDRKGRRRRFCRLNNSGWKAARRRAAAHYQQELGRPAPDGFRRVRVHDLKHTCGRRLRAAGVSLEDRQDILAHKTGRITTHYSAPEIGNLVAAVNRMCALRPYASLESRGNEKQGRKLRPERRLSIVNARPWCRCI
jgi:hypothetical protein